jgi:hypothetical protein
VLAGLWGMGNQRWGCGVLVVWAAGLSWSGCEMVDEAAMCVFLVAACKGSVGLGRGCHAGRLCYVNATIAWLRAPDGAKRASQMLAGGCSWWGALFWSPASRTSLCMCASNITYVVAREIKLACAEQHCWPVLVRAGGVEYLLCALRCIAGGW